MAPTSLLDLPDELLMNILSVVSTPSFIQAIATCTKLYNLAADSRDVLLRHLHGLPGIKLGLDDFTVRTDDLFLLLRQRASRSLYGAQFTADCTEFRYCNVFLDADASCMAEMGTDYTTISTVLKDSLKVRLYGSRCALKEHIDSPYADGEAKILQVVHQRFTISILYQWSEGSGACDPDIDTPIPHTTIAEKLRNPGDERLADKECAPKVRYHLLHYNAYTMNKPFFFAIDRHKSLIPGFLTVHSRLHCAIIWDTPGHGLSPSDHAEIVLYTASKCPVDEEGSYNVKVVWPTVSDARPVPPSKEDVIQGKSPRRPKRIAFYKDGRRLRIYAPGEIVPWHVIDTSSTYNPQPQFKLVMFPTGTTFRVDTPFYGQHETYTNLDDKAFCNMSHLCLGVAQVNGSSGFRVLCILRSKVRYEHDDCRHMVDLGRMAHVHAEDCTVVARLWGWQELTSSLTGLESVAISKLGTRIAIAMWNRVFIWALDPRMLCEDVQDIESDEEEVKSKRKKRKVKIKRKGVADDFYARKPHPILGWRMAELKPVSLDLQGAIARKMTWSVIEDTEESDDSDDDQNEPHTNTTASMNDEDENQDEGSSSEISAVPVEIIAAPDINPKAVVDNILKKTAVVCAPTPPHDNAQQGPDPVFKELQHHIGEHTYNDKVDPSVETQMPNLSELTILDFDPAQLSDTLPSQSPQDLSQSLVSDVATIKPDADSCIATKITTTLPVRDAPSNLDVAVETSVPVIPCSGLEDKDREELDVHVADNIGRPVAIATSLSLLSTASTVDKELPTSLEPRDEVDDTTLNTKRPPRTDISPLTKRHKKRHTEDELVIMTDRGIQVWDLGPQGRGKRTREWLAER